MAQALDVDGATAEVGEYDRQRVAVIGGPPPPPYGVCTGMASLSEVIAGVAGRIPVLIAGGFRRGTDIFKALALGATAVCIGRPYV